MTVTAQAVTAQHEPRRPQPAAPGTVGTPPSRVLPFEERLVRERLPLDEPQRGPLMAGAATHGAPPPTPTAHGRRSRREKLELDGQPPDDELVDDDVLDGHPLDPVAPAQVTPRRTKAAPPPAAFPDDPLETTMGGGRAGPA